MSKEKLFWLYATWCAIACGEYGYDNKELVDSLKEDAKLAGIEWNDEYFQKHPSWLEENLK